MIKILVLVRKRRLGLSSSLDILLSGIHKELLEIEIPFSIRCSKMTIKESLESKRKQMSV